MKSLFIQYPKCSTCQKAKSFLIQNDFEFNMRHIVEETPTVEELRKWWSLSGLELKKFFNTSGNAYKEGKLKDKLPCMSEEEQLELLASNGMLIKRPLLIMEDNVVVGFNEEKYKKLCK